HRRSATMSRQSPTNPLAGTFSRRNFLAGAGTVGLVAATGFTLTGCGSSDSGNTLKKAQDAGKITVGYAGERPHSFKGDDGQVTGAAIAIDSAAYKELGIDKVEGVLVDFSGLIP